MSPRYADSAYLVPIKELKPHPRNPRRGNVAVIKESLEVSGQYKPVLVQRSTNHILAGNHTWAAAKALGWSNISVSFIDCDDAEALEILLADNKASDAAHLDEDAVAALANSLPDLKGTGYDVQDLHVPDIDMDAYDPDPDKEAPEPSDAPLDTATVPFRLGQARGKLDKAAFEEWRARLPQRNSEALEEVLLLLGLVVPESPAPEGSGAATAELVPVTELTNYPMNPNQGDVGLLTTLLKHHGQTRPVIVSRRTNRILAGNHVFKAALELGWTHIGVSWVDVDADGEKRIVLADNRTAQLAEYSMDDLGNLIASIGAERIEATGYTLSDLDDIILGRSPHLRGYYRRGEMQFTIGNLAAKVRVELVHDLNLTPGQELHEIARIVGIDPSQVTL